MKLPLLAGIGGGIILQASKGILETPATFGKIAHVTFPLCGLSFYYLAGSYITRQIRGREGPFNNLLGVYCTFPVLRRFMPLEYTVAVLLFVSLPFYAVVREFYVTDNKLNLKDTLLYEGISRSLYLYEWKKEPSEHYVKRESYNIFTIPSK
ncbi:uncharacterized protein LOC100741696 isoform X2 [Bombus impatiens]|nr:uncharacterized protein LOC100741696 isoform X2 [Bombus impatiens]XP_033175595.1 uncharacterized protein LOC100741696 isoform X2 [Bombus impatiens]XP_033175596.1 uncharacterized protein LOC100741696 isoform X2 [Bombus impatiens]XP_033175597.1 uncharacterized protein LOC100741696 isoform X2 [Bombus impatiens]